MKTEFMFQPQTKNGYPLDEAVSTIQKAIRRGDEELALFFTLELFPKYAAYAWRRISVVAVEDIESPEAIVVVNSMRDAFFFNNEKVKNADEYKNRIFLTKAVLFLCREKKSREADHAQKYTDELYENRTISDLPQIPKYALDVHTRQGKAQGATKKGFFGKEQEALLPKGKDAYFKKLNLS